MRFTRRRKSDIAQQAYHTTFRAGLQRKSAAAIKIFVRDCVTAKDVVK